MSERLAVRTNQPVASYPGARRSSRSSERGLIDLETHEAVFTWMLRRPADAGLVGGKTVGTLGT